MMPISDRDDDKAPNLTLCDQEAIHIPGAIQPHGCLIACVMSNWTVAALSSNSAEFLGRPPEALLDLALDEVLPHKTVHDLRNVLQSSMVSGAAERLVGARIDETAALHDLTMHVSGSYAIIEILPQTGANSPSSDPIILVKSMLSRMKRAPNLDRFLHLAASQIRAMTGFDRVMVYKFLEDQSGKVVAESVRAGMTPFLGLHYPASDIPTQARALYKRQWIRLIPDIGYTPVPLLTNTGLPTDIDLGLAVLRSVSPIHVEYLRNMGSLATLTISLLDGDKLWGLIACHHDSPRRLSSSTCAAAELFGQIFSLQIEAKEQAHILGYTVSARETHDRLLASMPPDETVFDNLGRFAEALQQMIPCDGLSVYSDKGYSAVGTAPSKPVIDALLGFLETQPGAEPFVTDRLRAIVPAAEADEVEIAGIIAIPFTRFPRDYLIFFRREVTQTVMWGGEPTKTVVSDGQETRISPRKSFKSWREIVVGRSLPWTAGELQIAETLRVSLLEVILRRADLISRERRIAQERQTFLIAELNHRVKNILALIRSLVRQTRLGAQSIEGFADDLEQRVLSLALAHDQLTATGWRNAPLRRLLEAELRAWTQAPSRICLTGPPLTLASRAFQALALVFHELVTNAAKHGSLSGPAGQLTIAWARDANLDLRIEWREIGGPPVNAPQRRGFGSVVVEQVIPFELGGVAALDFRREGLHANFMIPAQHIGAEDAEPEEVAAETPEQVLVFKHLLLVEDSMMIALDAQAMLSEAGLRVEVAGTLADAYRLLGIDAFDAAVLDVNLSGETSFGLGDHLVGLGLPFIFATGYGESIVIPDRFKAVPVVSKPYDRLALRLALQSVVPAVDQIEIAVRPDRQTP